MEAKITHLQFGKSSEPNLHDFAVPFSMIFRGKNSMFNRNGETHHNRLFHCHIVHGTTTPAQNGEMAGRILQEL